MNHMVEVISNLVLLSFIVGIPIHAIYKKVDAFDAFVTGAKQGFELSVSLIPYLIAMLVGVSMLRASGFFECIYTLLAPVLSKIGVPSDLLPLALVRPFSGGAANGLMAEIIHQHGGDSYIAAVAATMMGSTETTFYVVAVYFGSVKIKYTRHAIPAGLLADLSGILASIYICQYLFL